mgnify:CR=1 FL=1
MKFGLALAAGVALLAIASCGEANKALAPITAAEVTREKLFLRIHDEIPYNATVETEKFTIQKQTNDEVLAIAGAQIAHAEAKLNEIRSAIAALTKA